MRLLLVEDDSRLASSLSQILERSGYCVDIAATYDDGYEKVFLEEYDLIILDWMLPDGTGVELCKEIRKEQLATPVLMLTARGISEDIAEGLDAGADDYLVKPFETKVLLARIRSLLRRKDQYVGDEFVLDNLKIDFSKRRVVRGKRKIDLTPKEMLILEYLARNQDGAVSRDKLFAHAWDENAELLSNAVDVYISYLRKKIDQKGDVPLIKTIKGMGYRLCKD